MTKVVAVTFLVCLMGAVAQDDRAVDEAMAIADQVTGDVLGNSLLHVASPDDAEPNEEADSSQAATDAMNAHKAAKMAKEAAKVAKKVATHSVQMSEHAKSALKKAHDAVNKARVETEGLSSDQKESLKKAEQRLKEATKAAEYGQVTNAKYVKTDVDDKRLKKLAEKMEKSKKAKDAELEAKQKELEAKPKKAKKVQAPEEPREETEGEAVPVRDSLDIDTEMPYGDLEPFGREDTAQELTEASVRESDEMVDQLERAEVAEEKRAVFRALTRLRGAAITSFDGVARSQTGNIDEYNKIHQWRNTHPLHHLADEESDVTKWAFPDNAD